MNAPPRADTIRRPRRGVFGESTPVRMAAVVHAHALAALVQQAGVDRQLALARTERERENRELLWQREAYLIRSWR
ncbi:MAG TPA: hypothetical protein VHZ81_12440 [Galbitalea sp.]|nr:hypothetical protein [Galbitalea sp.]